MISTKEVLMGRINESELEPELASNLTRLLNALNGVRRAFGKPMLVSSGYRTPDANRAAGGAKRSLHMLCLACDFRDPHGELDAWCSANQPLLTKLGLWQEHPDATPGWCHLDAGERPSRLREGCLERQFKP